jgi:acetate kinase
MDLKTETTTQLLIINAGSSSLKFAAFDRKDLSARSLSGSFEGIGLPTSRMKVKDGSGKSRETALPLPNHASCLPELFAVLKESGAEITGIGHRVVHGGMNLREPRVIDGSVIAELKRIADFAPEHLPAEIELIEALAKDYQGVPQIACFDTAFHQHLDHRAKMLAIPRRYFEQGIYRYGFHGLSYGYLMQQLKRIAGGQTAMGRIILAHLGNGASMAAVLEGRSVDTTMAFTPAAGLVMSSRSGDLDPGVASYLLRTERLTPEQFHRLVNEQSGLLGISEISPDMRELTRQAAQDSRAAEAIAAFSYHARKWIGSLAAAMGGLDTLVFSGGIGENDCAIRAQICDGLGFLGIELDARSNLRHAGVISVDASRVTVRVIPTDEEVFIAQSVNQLLSVGPEVT